MSQKVKLIMSFLACHYDNCQNTFACNRYGRPNICTFIKIVAIKETTSIFERRIVMRQAHKISFYVFNFLS